MLAVLSATAENDLASYVDPFIGTTNFSVCNPGAVVPHVEHVGFEIIQPAYGLVV